MGGSCGAGPEAGAISQGRPEQLLGTSRGPVVLSGGPAGSFKDIGPDSKPAQQSGLGEEAKPAEAGPFPVRLRQPPGRDGEDAGGHLSEREN